MTIHVNTFEGSGLEGGENAVLAKRPYISNSGKHAGKTVIAVNTGQLDQHGQPVYGERTIQTNAALRKDEWLSIDDGVIEAFEERLVIIDDLRSAGLTHNVGGLGTMIAEWETVGEMTDAEVDMDGETVNDKDRVGFGIDGVPIPIVHKDFRISERALLASRTRGAALDITNSYAAARAVARKSESMVFNGLNMGAVQSGANSYQVYGLLNKPNRPIQQISDWSSSGTSAETIVAETLSLISELEREQRVYGPFKLYIPNTYSTRFREDFKANSDKTLMERMLEIPEIEAVRISDTIEDGNVLLIQMTRSTIDLAVAQDVTTVNWESGSGFTNFFKTYAAWAPRIKTDNDGRFGYIQGATST